VCFLPDQIKKQQINSLLRDPDQQQYQAELASGRSVGVPCSAVLVDALTVQVAYAINETNAPIKSMGICAGSGGGVLRGMEADVYLTGEMGYVRIWTTFFLLSLIFVFFFPQHEVLAAVASGKNVILCGHTNTERGYLPILASKLCTELAKPTWGKEEQEVIKGLEVVISRADACPLIFV
jgi:putative NIF3 family GTP cyclohydrolase 1 type 2